MNVINQDTIWQWNPPLTAFQLDLNLLNPHIQLAIHRPEQPISIIFYRDHFKMYRHLFSQEMRQSNKY